MKILFVLSRFPWPLDKGDKLRAYHQIKGLSRNNEVYLFCLNDELPDKASLNALRPFCKDIVVSKLNRTPLLFRLLTNCFTSRPWQIAWFTPHAAKQQFLSFKNEIRPDVTFFQLVRTAEFADKNPGGQLLDYMDTLSEGMHKRSLHDKGILSALWKKEANRLRSYESEVSGRFSVRTIISETDRRALAVDLPVEILPNGVDTDRFVSVRPSDATGPLLFHGNMSYPPNEEAAQRIVKEILPFPELKKEGITVILSGANPSANVKQLESSLVKVTGWVDDLTDVFSGVSVFVAPFRLGTGMQNKLLEAMAAGIPCITSPQAAAAIGAIDEKHLLVADSNTMYVAGILRLRKDAALRDRLIHNGRNLISNMSWEQHAANLEALLRAAQLP